LYDNMQDASGEKRPVSKAIVASLCDDIAGCGRDRARPATARFGMMAAMPTAASADPVHSAPGRTVYCLCAEWCGVCREWRARFDALAAAHPEDRFIWVDVDAHEAVLDILDIETFPVLLIAQRGEPLFCGPIQPTAPVLERLLQGLQRSATGVMPQARQLLDVLPTS
jgi:thiol-disulfide isomerase/thioredoxin